MSPRLTSTLRRHGSGISRRSSSSRPASPNRSETGHGCPKVISVAWMRFFSVVRWRTRCSRKRASSRSRRMLGSGSQIAGTRSRHDSSASTLASILSVLHASGASPLTFCASAISTSQPCSSSVSCTNRAPFIDSITARTRLPRQRARARPRRPSASGGAAVSRDQLAVPVEQADVEPTSTQIQSSVQHESGPPRARSSVDTRSVPPRRPSFIAVRGGSGYRCAGRVPELL